MAIDQEKDEQWSEVDREVEPAGFRWGFCWGISHKALRLQTRHAELVSAPIGPLAQLPAKKIQRRGHRAILPFGRVEKWALKQVQGDGLG